jgi:hypothetical protein
MAGRLKIEITESAEYLEKSLKQARSGSQKERLQMLWWLKSGQGSQHPELSHRLGHVPATIPRCLAAYRQGGLSQLLRSTHSGQLSGVYQPNVIQLHLGYTATSSI